MGRPRPDDGTAPALRRQHVSSPPLDPRLHRAPPGPGPPRRRGAPRGRGAAPGPQPGLARDVSPDRPDHVLARPTPHGSPGRRRGGGGGLRLLALPIRPARAHPGAEPPVASADAPRAPPGRPGRPVARRVARGRGVHAPGPVLRLPGVHRGDRRDGLRGLARDARHAAAPRPTGGPGRPGRRAGRAPAPAVPAAVPGRAQRGRPGPEPGRGGAVRGPARVLPGPAGVEPLARRRDGAVSRRRGRPVPGSGRPRPRARWRRSRLESAGHRRRRSGVARPALAARARCGADRGHPRDGRQLAPPRRVLPPAWTVPALAAALRMAPARDRDRPGPAPHRPGGRAAPSRAGLAPPAGMAEPPGILRRADARRRDRCPSGRGSRSARRSASSRSTRSSTGSSRASTPSGSRHASAFWSRPGSRSWPDSAPRPSRAGFLVRGGGPRRSARSGRWRRSRPGPCRCRSRASPPARGRPTGGSPSGAARRRSSCCRCTSRALRISRPSGSSARSPTGVRSSTGTLAGSRPAMPRTSAR